MSAQTIHLIPPAPEGAREWLAEVLRIAVAEAEGLPARPQRGLSLYVVGRLLSEAQLSMVDADALMGRVL